MSSNLKYKSNATNNQCSNRLKYNPWEFLKFVHFLLRYDRRDPSESFISENVQIFFRYMKMNAMQKGKARMSFQTVSTSGTILMNPAFDAISLWTMLF